MFNATVGTPESNSYVSVEYADSFFIASINSNGWPTTQPQKEAALQEATRVLDEQFSWIGKKATTTQSLGWPRSNALDHENNPIQPNIIPKRVLDATCSLALFLIQNGGLSQAGSDLKGLKVGPIDLKFESSKTVVGAPNYVVSSLRSYGEFYGSSGGAASVKAIRC